MPLTNSMEERPTVSQTTKKFPLHSMQPGFFLGGGGGRVSLDSVQSPLNSVHMLTPHLYKIHYHAIVWSAPFLSGFSTNLKRYLLHPLYQQEVFSRQRHSMKQGTGMKQLRQFNNAGGVSYKSVGFRFIHIPQSTPVSNWTRGWGSFCQCRATALSLSSPRLYKAISQSS
jgi:hypothetical protein